MNYAGDTKFSKILEQLRIPCSVGEVKAYLMGTIAATNHAPMQVVLDHLYGGKEIVYEDEAQAHHFMNNLMGLWNDLAAHQEPDKPFRFSPLKTPAYPSELKLILSLRNAEILQFVRGLDAGDTDPQEFSKDGKNSFRYLAEADAIFENIIKVSEKDQDVSAATLQSLVETLKKVDEIIQDCVHRIILEAKDVRRQKLEALKEKEQLKDQIRHVGRNDPCPCGSGIKFKTCCLPKLQ